MEKNYRNGITKATNIEIFKANESDLEKINKYSLDTLTEEEVFVFKMVVATNENDDRNYMPFNAKAIEDMAEIYKGKTMISDHERKAKNQFARIYDTKVKTYENKLTENNEKYKELIVKAYMMRTESNKDLINDIRGGIKKEVSTSTMPEKLICSICGRDNMKEYCNHWNGEVYNDKICYFTIDGVKEAYELSFVAVPAQPNASTIKSKVITDEDKSDNNTQKAIEARIRIAENYVKHEKEMLKNENE